MNRTKFNKTLKLVHRGIPSYDKIFPLKILFFMTNLFTHISNIFKIFFTRKISIGPIFSYHRIPKEITERNKHTEFENRLKPTFLNNTT